MNILGTNAYQFSMVESECATLRKELAELRAVTDALTAAVKRIPKTCGCSAHDGNHIACYESCLALSGAHTPCGLTATQRATD